MTPRISDLATLRARHPEAVAEAAARRTRRPLLGDSGRLMIVAADHPARGALAVGDRQLAMANRPDLLERLVLALSRPGVDGVLATADILEDLLLLGALERKVVIGSMNRGGLAGAAFEMDDRFTGHRPQDLARLRFDAGKLLLRIDYSDPGSLTTLEATARAIDAMAERQLPVFVEPFLSSRIDGAGPQRPQRRGRHPLGGHRLRPRRHLRLHLAEAAGHRRPRRHGPGLRDLTLPTVLLGGDIGSTVQDQEAAYEKWRKALRLPTVQGLVVGRSLLYPADGDVAAAVDTAVGLL